MNEVLNQPLLDYRVSFLDGTDETVVASHAILLDGTWLFFNNETYAPFLGLNASKVDRVERLGPLAAINDQGEAQE